MKLIKYKRLSLLSVKEGKYMENIKNLINKGSYKEALQALLSIKDQHPDKLKILYWISLCCRLTDDYDTEKQIVNQALQLNPNHEYFKQRQHCY